MRTIRFGIFFAIIFSLSFISAFPVRAEGEPAKQTIEGFVQTIKAMEFPAADQAKNQELIKRANAALDLEAMGKKALVNHWESISPENQKEFMSLLWQLIEKVAYPNSRKFMGDFEIQYPQIVPDGGGFEVHTIIKQQEEALDAPVIYHVSAAGKIDDVILDGVSITEDLRFQFDKIIEQSQFQGLIDKMKERLATAEQQAAAPAAPAS